MKKIVAIISTFCLILLLVILYSNERSDRNYFEDEVEKWKTVAELEQRVPLINEEAQQFVKALHRGKHLDYLTGTALAQYKDALEGEISMDEPDEENRMDVSLQDISMLLSNTVTESEEEATSTVLYQMDYQGIFDNEEKGVVDRRIMTLLIKINWIEKEKDFLVKSYTVDLLDDTLGLDLSSSLKGSTN
jgi:hypothetical protein